MSRNSEVDFTKYVHKFTNSKGQTRYAVAEWSQENGQYTAPLDARTAKLTGCYAEFSRTVTGLGGGAGYKTKKEALRRARYLYGGA